ncbi:MAG: hypothetical protein HDQ96_15885 [Lachnospiraceae bacterium]|nr:hypothetical protein [Lachnospiraceae bacterium]
MKEEGVSCSNGELKDQERAYAWAAALCRYAGADETFLQDFWERLTADEEIYEEFVYYLDHQDFLYKVKVEGYGLVDLMVFQIDHFRAVMDRDVADMRHNKDKMLLMAFNSLLQMRKDPEPFVRMMQQETGTDRI